jgi:Tol biopolymer transport system component
VPESDLSVSPDGARLLFTATSRRTGLWAFPFDAAAGLITGEPSMMSSGSAGEVDFDADPSGRRVAYRAVRAGRHELWEAGVSGGQDRLLSSSMQPIIRPVWSPDGARLAFSRKTTAGDDLAVGVVNLDGTGERIVTEPSDVEMFAYDWSNDGRYLLGPCRFDAADRYSACLVDARDDSDAAVRVVASDPNRNLFNPRFSPDQRWISLLAHDLSKSPTSTVVVVPAEGGRARAVTDGAWFDDKPRWGPDGGVLYFVSNRDGVPNVWGRRFASLRGEPTGDLFPVTRFRSAKFSLTERTVSMEIAVTTRHLILPMTEARSEIWMIDGVDR